MATQPFAGMVEADCAFIERDGVAYRCYVWLRGQSDLSLDGSVFRGTLVEAQIVVEQDHGQTVVLDRATVRSVADPQRADCPRVVARGSTFVIHWIEYDPVEVDGIPEPSGQTLHRATLDLDASPYAWTHQGSISTGNQHLYDVHAEHGADTYTLAHATNDRTIEIRRVDGDTWVDNDWAQTPSAGLLTVDPNVLACYGSDDTGAVAVWQSGTRQLYAVTCNWGTGVVDQSPTPITNTEGDFTALGMVGAEPGNADLFLVAEVLHDDASEASSLNVIPWTLQKEFDASALAIGSRRLTPNTTLQSKPWAYASNDNAVTPTLHFFALLGFQGARAAWRQSNYYVARYERSSSSVWGRPVPVAAMNQGLANASPHKGRVPRVSPVAVSEASVPRSRMNHLPTPSPAPSTGPLVKTYTTAVIRWTRVEFGGSQFAPAGAGVRGVRFHHEDPWLYSRDASDPPQPSSNFASVAVPHHEHVPAGEGLFIGGAMPSSYDGSRIVETGFAWYPEILGIESVEDGQLVHGDVHLYTAIYEWRDAKGQTHRSAPAEPVTYTAGVGDSTPTSAEVTVRCCNLSMKDNAALLGGAPYNPTKIEIYRTEASGTVFYPLYRGDSDDVYSTENTPVNDPTTDTITITDDRPDADLVNASPLPFAFTNGVWTPLTPGPIPPMSVVATWKNRVWGVNAEQPNTLWYSLEVLPAQGGEQYTLPEFNPANVYRLDGVGQVTAMQPLDNSLVVFTRDRIYSLYGEPNDGNGLNATLTLQVLQENIGCVAPRSVAVATDGIYFQSRRGFYRLGRQNGLEYIGAPVEDDLRAAGNIRAVTVNESTHQVCLATNGAVAGDPEVLVYDALHGLWTKWEMPSLSGNTWLSAIQDAAKWRGPDGEQTYVVLAQSGVAYQRPSYDAQPYADDTGLADDVAVPVDIRTGWIKLAGIAGFKRVRKIGIQLSKAIDSGYRVDVEYDLDGSYTDGANLQTEIVASPAPAYIEVRTAIQKCSAIRIRLYEDASVPTDGATLGLHSITLLVAAKPGLRRVSPTTQRT